MASFEASCMLLIAGGIDRGGSRTWPRESAGKGSDNQGRAHALCSGSNANIS